MSTTFLTPTQPEDVDEIIDLTDRRRVFLRTIFGVEVPPDAVDLVFETADRDDAPEIIDLR